MPGRLGRLALVGVLLASGAARSAEAFVDGKQLVVWAQPLPTFGFGALSIPTDYHSLVVSLGVEWVMSSRLHPFVEAGFALGDDGCAKGVFCRPFSYETVSLGTAVMFGPAFSGGLRFFVAPKLTYVHGVQGRFTLMNYTSDPARLDQVSLGLDFGIEGGAKHFFVALMAGASVGNAWGVLGNQGPLWLPWFNVAGRRSNSTLVVDLNLNLVRVGYTF
jgi:hypothetical protein